MKKNKELKTARKKSKKSHEPREEELQARVVGASTNGPPKEVGTIKTVGKYSTHNLKFSCKSEKFDFQFLKKCNIWYGELLLVVRTYEWYL